MAGLAVVIPTLNEAENIESLVSSICAADVRCVVCDGGSDDDTVVLARRMGATVIQAPAGRANQLNAGAAACLVDPNPADWLLFLHADIRLPTRVNQQWFDIQVRSIHDQNRRWGRFDVRLVPDPRLPIGRFGSILLEVVGASMNWRSRLTGISTGDQGLLVDREIFRQVGGFPSLPLMEDIEMAARLKSHAGRPARLTDVISVSARRWQHQGVAATIISMWAFRLRYFFGASADQLHAQYYPDSSVARRKAKTNKR